MKRQFWSICRSLAVVLGLALAGGQAIAAGSPPLKGLYLTTDFPALTARAGETTTVKLSVHNYNLPPERVALSVEGVPQGWRALFLGGGAPVGAAMPSTNESVALQLRVDVPAGTPAGTRTLVLHARAPDVNADLPLAFTIGEDLPAQLSIKTNLPSLKGTPKTSFEFQFSVRNDGDKELLVKLAADAPPGFQPTFTEAYGTQEISSIPIDAGQSKDLKVKIQTPPNGVAAGDRQAEDRQAEDHGQRPANRPELTLHGCSPGSWVSCRCGGAQSGLSAASRAVQRWWTKRVQVNHPGDEGGGKRY